MSDTGRWVTLHNGVRVYIDEGQSIKDAISSSKQSQEAEVGVGGLHKQSYTVTKGYVGTEAASMINSALRNNQKSDRQEVIDRLDRNMEKTTKDMTVFREVDIVDLVDRMVKIKPEANTFDSLKKAIIGKSFTDKGFYSSYYEKTEAKYNNAVLETFVPKGTPAILTSNDKEKEVILSRGGTYIITDIEMKNGRFHLKVKRT